MTVFLQSRAGAADQPHAAIQQALLCSPVTAILLMPAGLMPAELPAYFMRVGRRPVQSDFMPEPLADLLPVRFA